MPRIIANATIPSGQSISGSIDCRTGTPLILFMPAQWTDARISYLLSHDGNTYYNLYDRTAREIAVNVRPGTAVRLNPEWTDAALGCYLKIRSGSADMATVQGGDRMFFLLLNS